MKCGDEMEFVTVPEAQRRTGLGRRQFRRAIERKELNLYQVGCWPRLRWESVLSWIEGKKQVSGDRPADTDHAPERSQ